MFAEALRLLYGYNGWATERVLDIADNVTSAQLLAPGSAGRGSLRDTIVHLIDSQRRWVAWWNGSRSIEDAYRLKLDPADFPDLAALRAIWQEVDRETQAFVSGLSDLDVARPLTRRLHNGTELTLPLWKMILHLANHGTQHRSEAAAMLTSFGHSPGDLDLLMYYRQ